MRGKELSEFGEEAKRVANEVLASYHEKDEVLSRADTILRARNRTQENETKNIESHQIEEELELEI